MKPAHVAMILAAAILSGCSSPSMSSPVGLPVVGFSAAWEASAGIAWEGSIEWRRPETTLYTGKGDCEDIAGLFIALAGGGEVVVVDGAHAIVYFPGKGYIEPQCIGLYLSEPTGRVERYNMSEYLAMCGK